MNATNTTSSGTLVNALNNTEQALAANLELEAGFMLPGDYVVISRIGNAVDSGEADVFLCEKNGRQFATKIFRRFITVNAELLQKLENAHSKFIAHLEYYGEVYNRHFEVYDYYKRGSLADTLKQRTFSESELRDHIIPNLNLALHSLHEKGILHRDIKPSNIMWSNDETWGLVLIDFGLSSVTQESLSVIVSQVGMSMPYAPPEVLRGVYFDESDYYSLGITLYQLFCGRTPYENRDSALTSVISKPGNMSQELYDLIIGLTYSDLSHRHERNNPNRRWTFAEVDAWLENRSLPVPGINSVIDERAIPPYFFCGEKYTDIDELCFAMAKNWEEGKKAIHRMELCNHLRNKAGATDNQLLWASIINDIVNNSKYTPDERMIRIFLKLSPNARYIYCPLGVFASTKDYGSVLIDMLGSDYSDAINAATESTATLIRSGALTQFVTNNPEQTASVELINHFCDAITHLRSKPALFEFAYHIAQRDDLDIMVPNSSTSTIKVHSVEEFEKCLLDADKGDMQSIYGICEKLFDDEGRVKAKVYSWLKMMGCSVDELKL